MFDALGSTHGAISHGAEHGIEFVELELIEA